MKIQTSTYCAIRILQYLHTHQAEVSSAAVISQSIGIAYPFLIKIANQLKHSGLIDAVQGRNGGYFLARPAQQISVYDAFLATAGKLEVSNQRCSRGVLPSHLLDEFFCELQEKIIEEMKRTKFSELSR